jgi:phytanoyl-CoA hydroxylase
MINDKPRLTPLTQEQIDHYDKHGYLLIRKGCSEDMIDAYNAHIYHLRSLPIDEMEPWVKNRMHLENGNYSEKTRFTTRVFCPHQYDSFSLQMMKLPIIRGAVAQLLGDEAMGIQSMYFFKEPGASGQAAHQDYNYIRNEPNTLIGVWMAMDDTDEENGCLWVLPGSHRFGLLKHGDVKNRKEHDPDMSEIEEIDLTQEIPVVMEKGDILIIHNLVVHSSLRNRSPDRWRRANVFHYLRHDSVITVRDELKQKYALI